MKTSLTVLAVSCIILGCHDWRYYDTKPTEIYALYYHENNVWSVAVKTGDTININPLPQYIPVIIVADAKDFMSYSCKAKYDMWTGKTIGNCTIHVRSCDDINTAGWDHGKFGRGTTVRVR